MSSSYLGNSTGWKYLGEQLVVRSQSKSKFTSLFILFSYKIQDLLHDHFKMAEKSVYRMKIRGEFSLEKN